MQVSRFVDPDSLLEIEADAVVDEDPRVGVRGGPRAPEGIR